MAEPGNGSVKLTWNAVSDATGYKVLKATASSTTSDSGYAEITTGVTALFYDVTGLEPGQRYYFKVIATAGGAVSPSSTEVTAVANVDDQGNVFAGNKLLISNQSTDIVSTQSTGTLSVNVDTPNMNIMDSKELDPEAYRINPVIPFEAVEGQEPVNFNMEGELQTQEVTYTIDATKNFTTQNTINSSYYTTTARCAYVGNHVVVWVDNDNSATVKLTNDQAKLIGEEFDSIIYNLVRDNFYTESDVNADGKVAILCFDIKDSYNGVGTGYVGGYFWGGDLYSTTTVANSNEMEIFYADTYPTMIKSPSNPNYTDPDVTKVYSTLAHEFQHMVNFNCNRLVESDKKDMDTWLNEALSLAAEDMYDKSESIENGTRVNRIAYYNGTVDQTIANGQSLLEWNSSLSNYSLSYLFSQYLRTQIDQAKGMDEGIKTYKSIIEDPTENYVAVENAIKTKVDTTLSFGQFMTNFRAAMLLKADSGPYGFNGEAGFNAITTPTYSGTGTTLKGGGAVVKSITSSFTPSGHGSDINYLGIYN